MKIESIIRREGGSVVELDGSTYRFKPDDAGRHVADVADEAHIARFLAIPEGYRLVLSEDDRQAAQREAKEREVAKAKAEADRIAAEAAEAERRAAEAEAEDEARKAKEAEAAAEAAKKAAAKKGK